VFGILVGLFFYGACMFKIVEEASVQAYLGLKRGMKVFIREVL
jgi:Leu/Phe-tRNA-protein transferase